tara:strand:+ start:5797 stop:6300 length:504 start_codon:yes stop_codon:yes gene_type:complete
MSKVIQHLNILHNNPFLLTPIIVNFYEKYSGNQEKDMLLAYLILPLVLYESSKLILKTKRKELRTFINCFQREQVEKSKLEIKKNDKLFGLPGRVEEYKELTNLCLQYGFDTGSLQLNRDLSITFLKNDFKADNSSVEYIKAAENLALLLKKEKITHIYMKLGVKKI